MYIRIYERLGQPPEELRDYEEQKRRFGMLKAEHVKRLASLNKFQFTTQCPGGTQSAQTYKLPFTSAERNITEKDALQIFTILCGPSRWQQYLRSNLNAHLQDLPMQPIRINDGEFARRYQAIFNIPAPADAQGFVDRRNATIHLKEFPAGNKVQSKVGIALHEAVHLFSHPPGKSNQSTSTAYGPLGTGLLEGLTQVITEDIQTEQGISPMRDSWQAYKEYVPVARELIRILTPAVAGEVYFQGNTSKLHEVIQRRWTPDGFVRVKRLADEKKTNQALQLINSLEQVYRKTVGAPSFPPEIAEYFSHVRWYPEVHNRLLLTVTFHPSPLGSNTFANETFVSINNRTRNILEQLLHSGVARVDFLDALRLIRDARWKDNEKFKQQIKAELKLRSEMYDTAGKKLVSSKPAQREPFLVEALLADYPGDFCRSGASFARKSLPLELVRRIVNSEASEAHLTNLGGLLQRFGEILQRKDAAFKQRVEQERKKRTAAKTIKP